MPIYNKCPCINTAILLENENEKLRIIINKLEKKIKKYNTFFYNNNIKLSTNNIEYIHILIDN